MIFVRDKGQMCNNILQYGHLYAWGREHGRRTLSMRFAYKYRYFKICHTPGHHFASYVWAKTGARFGFIPVVSFDSPDRLAAGTWRLLGLRNAVAQGWEARFYDLFLKYLPEIKELFDFLPAVRHTVDEKMKDDRGADTVNIGIHVRRGDYARWHDGRYFFDDGQYLAVIAGIGRLYPDKRKVVWICTNDSGLDQARFVRELTVKGMEARFPNGNPGEDLCLLSECDVLAGAPSTFSLVASMYKDLPLYWISDPDTPVGPACFSHFSTLFRHIL